MAQSGAGGSSGDSLENAPVEDRGEALCGSAWTWEEAPPRWIATLTGADESAMNLRESPGPEPVGPNHP